MLGSLTEEKTACKGICMNTSHYQDVPVFFMVCLSTLIDKSDPSCPTKHEDFWILNGIQCSWVQIPLRPTFYNYLKNPSVVNTIRIDSTICIATNVIICARFRLKQMWRLTKAMVEMKHEHWAMRWNCSSCTKLALSANWTHGLIAQSVRANMSLVRASERNSVVVGSNPTQANVLLLLLKILQWWSTKT